jgi:hypothetical protein
LKRIISFAFAAGLALAQETVAPTTDLPVSGREGANTGRYSIVNSWDFGYRFATVGGDEEKYRSDVNFGNGVRLLGSSLTINSRDGRSPWLDELSLTTQGLGNDPYESVSLRARRNRIYEYDLSWRENAYFNPGLITAAGEHVIDTTYRWQDHELTLLPQNWFRMRAGYSRVTQDGPALTTEQEFDSTGDVFPIFRNIREQLNEYRLGGDVRARGIRLTILHRWEYFREDLNDADKRMQNGVLISTPGESLSNFSRSQPYRGRTPTWFGNLFVERRWFTADARFTYAGGRGDFVQNENAIGIDRFGALQNRQIAASGNGARPLTAGDFNIALLPECRFNISAGVSVSNTRTSGSNLFSEFNNSAFSFATVNFQFLGIRLITTSVTARYRFTRTLNIFTGFRYADRQIRSTEDVTSPGFPLGGTEAEQVNLLRAGVAGFNWTPLTSIQLSAEAELGRANNPFTPISLRNYEAVRTRLRYRARSVTAAISYRENYNSNSIILTAYSSRIRTYSAEASWNGKMWLAADASYSKLHLDTIGGIAFFAGSDSSFSFVSSEQSVYISNVHAANIDLRLAPGSRVRLFIGYSIIRDAGGKLAPVDLRSDPAAQLLQSVQTYPLTYQTPFGRISWELRPKLQFNVGYQYYGYREDFGLFGLRLPYRANTGYTSLLWSF